MPISISKFKQLLAFLIAAFCFTLLLSAETTFTPADLGAVPIAALPAGSAGGLPGDQPFTTSVNPVYGGQDGLALWRPATGLVLPSSFADFYTIPVQQIGTPIDVPF